MTTTTATLTLFYVTFTYGGVFPADTMRVMGRSGADALLRAASMKSSMDYVRTAAARPAW